MSTFTMNQAKGYSNAEKSKHLRWGIRNYARFCQLYSRIPRVAMSRDVMERVTLSRVDGLAFPGSGATPTPPRVEELSFYLTGQSAPTDVVDPRPFETKRTTRDIRIDRKVANAIGMKNLEGVVQRAVEEVENLHKASVIYGGEDIALWMGWPQNFDGQQAYDFQYAPAGFTQLVADSSTGYELDFSNTPMSLDVMDRCFNDLEMPAGYASYAVMNSDMLYSLAKAWHDQGQPIPLVPDPENPNKMLPSHQGVPILISNFIASSVSTANHPETGVTAGNTSSVFLVHFDPQDPLKGLCMLYPEEQGGSPIRVEEIGQRDDENDLVYRINLEYCLYAAQDNNVVRAKGVGLVQAANDRIKLHTP